MKKLKFPTPYTVLLLVIIFAAILTYLLPSGTYSTLSYSKAQNEFIIQTKDTLYSVPATQQELDKRAISIQLEKFTSEKIKKPISIPNTYEQDKPHPQGISAILFAPIKGIYDSIEVILFV